MNQSLLQPRRTAGPLFIRVTAGMLVMALLGSHVAGCGTSVPTVLSFRGAAADLRFFSPIGAGGRQFISRTPEGWSIAVPGSFPSDVVGLMAKGVVQGDFCLEAAYEFRAGDDSGSDAGTGPSLYLATDAGAKNAVKLARLLRTREGSVIAAAFLHSDRHGHRQHDAEFLPTQSSSGRLKLQRQGEMITYSTREGDADWREVRKVDFGRHPISTMRLALEKGDSTSSVKMTWTEISLELSELPLSWRPAWQRRMLFLVGALSLPVSLVLIWLLMDSIRGGWRYQTPGDHSARIDPAPVSVRESGLAISERPEFVAVAEEPEVPENPSGDSHVPQFVAWAVLVVCCLYGIWMRVDGLGDKHLWLDEALSWRLAQLPFHQIAGRTSEVTTVHPPLYFVMLRSWMLMTGDSEAWLRGLATMFGIAGFGAAFAAGRNLEKSLSTTSASAGSANFAGALAAMIFALNPFQAHLAQQVRGYTFAVFCCLISTSALVLMLSNPQRRSRWAVLYVIAAVAACYTHHLTALTTMAQGGFALCWTWSRWNDLSLANRKSLRRTLITVAASTAMLLIPLASPLLRQTEAAADAWMRPMRGRDIVIELADALVLTSSSPPRISELVDAVAVAVLGLLLFILVFAMGWGGRCLALLGLFPVWTLAVYSTLASRSLFDARYFAFAQSMWLIGAAMVIARLTRPADRWIVIAVIGWFCFQLPWLKMPETVKSQHGIRTAVEYLRNRAAPDDVIVAASPAIFFEASYYARRGPTIGLLSETRDRTQHEAAAHLNDHDLVHIDDIAAKPPGRIWVITMPAYDRSAERFLPLLTDYSLASETGWRQDWPWERTVDLLEYKKGKGKK